MSGKRPLTYADIIALLLTKPTRNSETVTLKTVRGETQTEVTVVVHDGETLMEAWNRAKDVKDYSDNYYANPQGFPLPEYDPEEVPFA